MTTSQSAPSPMFEAFKQVAKETGVSWRAFYHVTDANGSELAELNRRAYALMAAKAGVRALPAFAAPGGNVAIGKRYPAPVLRRLYDALVARGEATVKELAGDVQTHRVTTAHRMARLNAVGVVQRRAVTSPGHARVYVYTPGPEPFETVLALMHGRRGIDSRAMNFLSRRAQHDLPNTSTVEVSNG